MTTIQVHINIQKRDLGGGGGMLGESDRMVAVEMFKELCEEVGTMRPEKEDVINKTQLEGGLYENGMKYVLFKEAHEQIGVGGCHSCAHDSSPFIFSFFLSFF